MYINIGVSEFEFRTQTDFVVNTQLALKWAQSASGDWHATDRGSSNDYYETTIKMAGCYSDIGTVLTGIESNRSTTNEITLTRFADNEKIFGADIIHDNLTATVISFPKIVQKSFRLYTIQMKLRLLSTPSFTAVETLPDLVNTQVGFDGNIDEYTITKYDTYQNSYTYIDEDFDVGLFKGTIILPEADMARLRRYHAINRGTNFSLSDIPGVFYPFGILGDTYPINVRIKDISNEKYWGLYRWSCDIELVNYKS